MPRSGRRRSRSSARRCPPHPARCASSTGSTTSRPAPSGARPAPGGGANRLARRGRFRAIDSPPQGCNDDAQGLPRYSVPDGVSGSARLRPGDPVPARRGARPGRQRLRRDAAGGRLLADAVPVHPGLGPPVGSRGPPAGAALEHRRHRRRHGAAGHGAEPGAAVRRALVERHRHRQHRRRAGLHRRRHAARAPRARHGDHRHGLRPGLHHRAVRRAARSATC